MGLERGAWRGVGEGLERGLGRGRGRVGEGLVFFFKNQTPLTFEHPFPGWREMGFFSSETLFF